MVLIAVVTTLSLWLVVSVVQHLYVDHNNLHYLVTEAAKSLPTTTTLPE